MRITFQPSTGRGEYEISETASNGIRPVDLVDYFLNLRIDTITFYTSVKLTDDQNKYRLRVVPKNKYPQVQNQIAYLLLMPKPMREERKAEGGQPVLQDNTYIIKNINIDNVALVGSDKFIADIMTIDCQNQSVSSEQIIAEQRMREIQKIWQHRYKFPGSISSLLLQHEQLVRSGNPIPKSCNNLLAKLQDEIKVYGKDVDIPYVRGTDIVPVMMSMINDVMEEMPLALDLIAPEQIELRRREIKKWKSYVSRRGFASVKFRKAVQKAYDYKCLVCGLRFPPTEINDRPGTDAAHILPWSLVDLDEVYNGVNLCKLHHWAFDEGLIVISYRDEHYYVSIPQRVNEKLHAPEFNIDELQKVVGLIPESRLPREPNQRPRPELLERLQTGIFEEPT